MLASSDAQADEQQGEPETIMVSRAKAKAMLAERRRIEASRVAQASREAKEARDDLIDNEIACEWEFLQEDSTGKVAETVHASHKKVVVCGGYAGCTVCGRFASTLGKANRLREPCRGQAPLGSLGATRRLMRGMHPLAAKGKTWPSREKNPRPKRLCT